MSGGAGVVGVKVESQVCSFKYGKETINILGGLYAFSRGSVKK